MKKKILIALLALTMALIACGREEKPSESNESSTEAASEASEASEANDESEEESGEMSDETSGEINRTWPVVSGTFMQPWAFTSYTTDNWKTHFENLKEVGIDIFIVQWIADTPEGKIKSIYYPSSLTDGKKTSDFSEAPDMLPRILEAAEESGIKVFVGLNLSDEWWTYGCSRDSWNQTQSELGIDMASEIYGNYKNQYPNALYGWYFAWEMFNGMSGYEKKAGEFLNMYLDPLTELDPSMPLLLSPFVRSGGSSAEKAGEEWKKVFAEANFREGDIFCCQDAVGAGHITIDQLDGYFAALKSAVDTEEGLLFWANSENFTTDYKSANISRFIRQMEIARPYVSGYVTFAYSHYYAKDYGNKGGYNHAYKHYYDTGETEIELKKPELSYTEEDGKIKLDVVCDNNKAGIQKVVISVSDRSDSIKEIPLNQLNEESFSYRQTITPKNGESAVTVTVTVYDYYGSTSSETLNINFS